MKAQKLPKDSNKKSDDISGSEQSLEDLKRSMTDLMGVVSCGGSETASIKSLPAEIPELNENTLETEVRLDVF